MFRRLADWRQQLLDTTDRFNSGSAEGSGWIMVLELGVALLKEVRALRHAMQPPGITETCLIEEETTVEDFTDLVSERTNEGWRVVGFTTDTSGCVALMQRTVRSASDAGKPGR